MEGKVNRRWASALLVPLVAAITPIAWAQQGINTADGTGSAEISLRKTIGAREYKGKTIEGEEREVRSGETMWHILVREKGLSGDRFKEYFVLIRGLNPQVKTPEALRVGDKIFIPLKIDEALALEAPAQSAPVVERAVTSSGRTQEYTVKAGDHLYQILRNQLGVLDDRKVWQYFALVKDLNPQKSNWDVLERGETIRLPAADAPFDSKAVASKPSAPVPPSASGAPASGPDTQVSMIPPPAARPAPAVRMDYAERLSARDNFALISMIAESLGNEVQQDGEEVVTLNDGAIRLDKNRFPVVYNKALEQRVILDGDDKIPDSLRANLKQQSVNTPVVSMAKSTTVQEAVEQLLARLGYQSLPGGRPVVVHEAGVSVEANGQWSVMAPQQTNKPQEIIVINLANSSDEISGELEAHLAAKGLHLKSIGVGDPAARGGEIEKHNSSPRHVKVLSGEKSEVVDALLTAYDVAFGVKDVLTAEVYSGLQAEISPDRTFDMGGRKAALFFRAIDPAIKTALETKNGIKVIELDFAALKSREVVAKLLRELGEKSSYKEHRFAAAKGSLKDRVVMTTAGFLLTDRSLFLTDREIPTRFQPIFFERGLDIVYFQ
jgi:hypothetical protein